ncbi:cell division protein ZapA [Peptoniphilus asaccharolyticus]
MSSEKVKVQIDDMNFYVVGGEETKVKKFADDLDKRIKTIQNSNYRLNQIQALILTALNILEEKDKEAEKLSNIQEGSVEEKNLNTLNEIEELKAKLNSSISENVKLKEQSERKQKDYDSLINENQKLREDSKQFALKIKELTEEVEKTKSEKNSLEEQIFESQKRIIDLNREIESLNDR